ncbi:hypothetical protein LARI1_G006696 [Lachnellula arida]|uniref:Fe2OG dioxygenase domain-containing protein n=1 Tax=Lachnellula arida TaxID=1316785 RepID=A0A8T9B981_9HELO|nr:hypothetical protein LARI1_G006696 [Lachnellula arida]
MATEGISIGGTPERFYSNTINTPVVKSSSKETQESLKRSFQKYLASEQTSSGPLFIPSKHLAYDEPKHIHTMEDIGYSAANGVSPMAVSEPFRLFSEEAVDVMRDEIFNVEAGDEYTYASNIAPKQLRGYAPRHGKFTFNAWKHPETLAIISKIAGIELVPVIDYEIAHINLSVPGDKKELAEGTNDDDDAIVGWHRDSYPFVCVLMMSDTTNMVGGETALKTGTGEIRKVRGPSKGCAVVLQGRYIDHQALKAFGGQERITAVTSFRPKNPHVRDDTVLNTVRPISNLPDLYNQVMEYQLENAEARIRGMLKDVRDSMKAGTTDVKAIKNFLDFEIKALQAVDAEIVEESKVVKGHLPPICESAKRRKSE